MPAFYIASVAQFLDDNPQKIIGTLTEQGGLAGFYQQIHQQTLSWSSEISILKKALSELKSSVPSSQHWGILLEYPITRRQKRIDIVLIAGEIIVVIEFKVGNENGEEQLMDYCLDLRDFHFESRNRTIIPILLSVQHKKSQIDLHFSQEVIYAPIHANADNLYNSLFNISNKLTGDNSIDYNLWNASEYAPTPTIIEAAQALFSGKNVIEISRSHAGKKNLTRTTKAVLTAIEDAKKNKEKIICFITGVPGAGKTLAGLNIAHHMDFQKDEQSIATFLSGNGPLIRVLREALTRDAYKRLKTTDISIRKLEQERIIAFIENVHRFIEPYYLDENTAPNNKVIIFDEAQRAWNKEQSDRKFKRPHSEPEIMLNVMDRHKDWAVIVALVGGGQEINTGEAGLREWGKTFKKNLVIGKFMFLLNSRKVTIAREI